MVFVELPAEGTEVAQAGLCFKQLQVKSNTVLITQIAQIGAVESVKAASDVVRLILSIVLSLRTPKI